MYVDALLLLSDAQAFTTTAVSTNSIDLGILNPDRRVAAGEPIGVMVTVDVAADLTTGNETYQVDLVSDDTSTLGDPTVLASFVVPAGELAAGDKRFFAYPPTRIAERYIGYQLTTGGTTPTVTLTASVMPQSQAEPEQIYYPSGYDVT